MTDVQILETLTPEERARLAELEEIAVVGITAALLAGRALIEIRDRCLFRAEFSSFSEYLDVRFSSSRQRAYQLINYAEAAKDFEAQGLLLPPERIVRALGGVPASDYALVTAVARETSGRQHPTSADVKAVADVVRDMAAGMVEHPETREPTPFEELPAEKKVEAVTRAVRRTSQDYREFQGVEDVKPWEWLENLRASGTNVSVEGTAEGWQVAATDRSTGEHRIGPNCKSQWDAIRGARAAWESELEREA